MCLGDTKVGLSRVKKKAPQERGLIKTVSLLNRLLFGV